MKIRRTGAWHTAHKRFWQSVFIEFNSDSVHFIFDLGRISLSYTYIDDHFFAVISLFFKLRTNSWVIWDQSEPICGPLRRFSRIMKLWYVFFSSTENSPPHRWYYTMYIKGVSMCHSTQSPISRFCPQLNTFQSSFVNDERKFKQEEKMKKLLL